MLVKLGEWEGILVKAEGSTGIKSTIITESVTAKPSPEFRYRTSTRNSRSRMKWLVLLAARKRSVKQDPKLNKFR